MTQSDLIKIKITTDNKVWEFKVKLNGGMQMASKEQLRRVAEKCSQHRYTSDDGRLISSINPSGYVEKSCENCIHFTEKHRCDLDLTDEILTNMAMEMDYDEWV